MKSIIKHTFLSLIAVLFFSCNQKWGSSDLKQEYRKKIVMKTNYGTLILELYNETPLHRDNFIKHVNNNSYDSLLFHRVVNKFIIQGGAPESREAKPNELLGARDLPYVIEPEFNADLFHKKGALAAAESGGLDKTSHGMQFYIVQGKINSVSRLDRIQKYKNEDIAKAFFTNDTTKRVLIDSINYYESEENSDRYNKLMDSILNIAMGNKDFKTYSIPKAHKEVYKSIGGAPFLDQSYTVFGEVIEGLNVIDSIASVATNSDDRPLKDVRILSVKFIK